MPPAEVQKVPVPNTERELLREVPEERRLLLKRQKMHRCAKVALDEGYIFGPEGDGFERLNLAAPRALIEKIMVQIANAFFEN